MMKSKQQTVNSAKTIRRFRGLHGMAWNDTLRYGISRRFGGIDIYVFDQLLKGRIVPGMRGIRILEFGIADCGFSWRIGSWG